MILAFNDLRFVRKSITFELVLLEWMGTVVCMKLLYIQDATLFAAHNTASISAYHLAGWVPNLNEFNKFSVD